MVPFKQMAIDTIGPWKININNKDVTINAHSVIDTCSNSLESKRASQSNPTGRESVQASEDTWLSCHPKPVRIICDQGTKCKNIAFKSFLVHQGIKGVPCAVKNPQSNAILERVHDVIKTSLRSEASSIADEEDANQLVDCVLASAQCTVRVCINKTCGLSPGNIVFQRDMLPPIPIIVNPQMPRAKRQTLIDKNNLGENA